MKLLFSLGTMLATLVGQECRVTPLSPAQPPLKVEEGERATESQTFQTGVFALSPANQAHFFDAVNRVRRMEANGRLTTLAGTGGRADGLVEGPALTTALPAVSQLVFSPAGVLHFVAVGRVWRVVAGVMEAVAGSGLPGFNGEQGAPTAVNLGTIVNAAFTPSGELLVVDGFARVRRLDADGILRTIAGGPRAAAAAGLTGDNGLATEAALSSPRQVVAFRDGTIWIRDLTGRHLRSISADGVIRTLQTSFDTNVSIFLTADRRPMAVTANRVYPISTTGALETGQAPYPPFTGTPRGIGPDGALYFEGGARPDQRNPLVRLDKTQVVIAGAPVAATIDGQAPPFGAWRNGSLLYAAQQGGKSGILEVRPGQAPRFVVGGGDDVGDAEGKTATNLTIFGVQTFTVDGAGRIVISDVYRQRILVVEPDGKVSILKSAGGLAIVYAPIGSLATLQRIAADQAGNIYWYVQGGTPTGGVFTASISVWTRSSQAVTSFNVTGITAIGRLDNGTLIALAGNSANFRTAYLLTPDGLGEAITGLRMLPLQSATILQNQPYFIAASRLFRSPAGRLEMLNLPLLPNGATFTPDFVLSSAEFVMVHLTNGGFYRIEDAEACSWAPQPVVTAITNAASFGNSNTISPRQLITLFGTGLGPAEGQGLVLDGLLRAGGQPAPYPAMVLGNFSGTIPLATLTGTTLPVLYSNDRQVTVQGVATVPASGELLLYFSWQGLTLIHPVPAKVITATPGLFDVALNDDGARNGANTPVLRGGVLQLYATGLGAIDTNPALGDFFSREGITNTVNTVTATVGDWEAEVLFAGGAPGQIGGLYQVNVRVPAEAGPGLLPLTLSVAGQVSNSLMVTVR